MKKYFDSDGVKIAYDISGQGEPVLLIHGFASSGAINWHGPGWVKFLTDLGRKVIVIDNRGHGDSEKLYDTTAYGAEIMAQDAERLLDHLGIGRCDVMGYSMGARITALLTIRHADRVNRAVFGGMAERMIRPFDGGQTIADALLAKSEADVSDERARMFRRFAEKTGGDLKALAACMISRGQPITPEMVATISRPVLVVAGSKDDVAGPIEPLVSLIAQAKGVELPGKDHMNSVGDKGYKHAVRDFWQNDL